MLSYVFPGGFANSSAVVTSFLGVAVPACTVCVRIVWLLKAMYAISLGLEVDAWKVAEPMIARAFFAGLEGVAPYGSSEIVASCEILSFSGRY